MQELQGIEEVEGDKERYISVKTDGEDLNEEVPEEKSPLSQKMNYCFPPSHVLSAASKAQSFTCLPNKLAKESQQNQTIASPPDKNPTERQRSKKKLRRVSTFHGSIQEPSSPPTSKEEEKKEEEKKKLSRGMVKMKKIDKGFRLSQRQLIKGENFTKVTEDLKKKNKISLTKTSFRFKMTRRNTEYFYKKQRSSKDKQYCLKNAKAPEDGILTISIVDNGCGMSDSDKEQLFKPFSQANKAVHSKFGGTGLGLWLCQKLLIAMKGTINCTSVLGKGTTFTISLPMKCKTNTNEDGVKSSQSQTMFSGSTVILYLKNIQDVASRLKNLGCNVVLCSSMDNLLDVIKVFIRKLIRIGKWKFGDKETSGCNRIKSSKSNSDLEQDRKSWPQTFPTNSLY